MSGYLLDTNIVSLAMQGDRDILERLERSRLAGVVTYISGVTYFEIRRGLLAKNAIAQMRRFENLSRLFQIILLDDYKETIIFEKGKRSRHK
ncbi:MAG: twitching motility protein PilT [Spirulina sp.]